MVWVVDRWSICDYPKDTTFYYQKKITNFPMIKILRILGNVEGVSYLLLLFIAMPLKYAYDMPMAVKITGMAHGVLFVAYCMVLALCMKKFSWKLGFGVYLFIATLIPFGTFVTDRKLKFLPEASS